ncbi:MAG: energy transducer TonB [Spirochaetota bacterium]
MTTLPRYKAIQKVDTPQRNEAMQDLKDTNISGYANLDTKWQSYWGRGFIKRSFLASFLLHGSFVALLVVGLGMKIKPKYRKFQLSDSTTNKKSLRISVNTTRPKIPSIAKPKKQANNDTEDEKGEENTKEVSRFNSDVLLKNQREIFNSITYPRMARRMEWEGRVRIQATVAADGSVISVRVATSSGYGILDDAALKGVRSHSFVAGTKTETVTLSFRFQLNR